MVKRHIFEIEYIHCYHEVIVVGTTVGSSPQLLEGHSRIITAGYKALSLVLKTTKFTL
jgi:hypothetical protein